MGKRKRARREEKDWLKAQRRTDEARERRLARQVATFKALFSRRH